MKSAFGRLESKIERTFETGGAAPAGGGDRPPSQRLSPLLHALLLAAAFVIFAWPIATTAGVIFGASAAVGGAFGAEYLCRARYRLPVIIAVALASALFALGVSWLFANVGALGSLIGADAAVSAADLFRFAGLALGASMLLRALAIRYRVALAIEGTLVVLAVAVTVAAHRDGMIARPLDISDWFWSRGVDPVIAFLAIGFVGALLLAGILAYERPAARTMIQLGVVLLIGGVVAAQFHGREPDEMRDVTGRTKAEKEKEDEERNKTRPPGGGASNPDDKRASGTPKGFETDGMPPRGSASGNSGQSDSGAPQNRQAAIVVFHRGVTPTGGVFYFRHAAFSQFNGSRLVEATIAGVDAEVKQHFPGGKTAVPGTQHFEEGHELVATDVALLHQHARMFMLTDGIEAEPLPNPDPARFHRAYRVLSSVFTSELDDLIGRSPGAEGWSDEVWRHYTTLPRDERYHALAAELQGKLRSDFQSDPLALALTVKEYLEENATYSFSRKYEGDEPTADFLFSEDKKGYCVHLAHAAAYLLRALGVPARVSAGYAVPASNLGGGSALLIKSSDAHAWAEIYLAGMGWIPVEVTPQKTDVEPNPFQEQDLQSLLGEMARKEGRQEREAAQRENLGEIFSAIGWALLYALLALIAFAYLVKLWRVISPAIAARRQQPLVAYRAALDRLSAIGVVRSRGESREHFAGRTSALAPSFAPLTAAHVGVALGSRQERNRTEKLGGLSSGVGKEVRKAVPWWRWLLGVLNPINWLWSR